MDLKQQMVLAHQMMSGFEIPMMPAEIVELQRLFSSTEFPDMQEVASIIERNTVLSGEVIKLANQPIFLRKGADQVKSIKGALDALGVGRVKNLVIGLGFKAQVKGHVFDALIDHSLDIARVSAAVSRWVDGVDADEAYLAGLFHNAGAFILAMKFDDYEDFFYKTITHCYSGLAREAQRYKVSHNVYGLLISKKWNLDNVFSQVILVHHQKDLSKIANEKVRTLVAIIQLANAIVSEVSFDTYLGSEVREMSENAQQELLIAPDVVSEIRLSVMSNSL
ncbi:HDOD domain-containing protein [Thiosulfativibrio zosterae]|nr:HDOD domain-containing protein [Thiosulfativibrio zosterae]